MCYDKKIEERYRDKLNTSFDLRLNYYLFNHLIRYGNYNHLLVDDFLEFDITPELISIYHKANMIKSGKIEGGIIITVEKIDDILLEWDKDYQQLESEFYKKYESFFHEQLLPIKTFIRIYPKNIKLRKCYYCDITEPQIIKLRKNGIIKTKNKRGSVLEIDRLNSDYEYTSKNIVLACYWCNNAKTDEFSSKEFKKHVGPGIKKIWEKRMLSMY